jgi:hypothetical protein
LAVYDLYGVESSWKGFVIGARDSVKFKEAKKLGFTRGKMEGKRALIPADFLIGPDLIIRRAYYGKDIGDHIPIKEIKLFLQ